MANFAVFFEVYFKVLIGFSSKFYCISIRVNYLSLNDV